jgi:hypothetical protein
MTLLDEVHELQQRYTDAGRYERVALNVAASLLEEVHLATTGKLPEVVTRWTYDDSFDLPDTFEILKGRISPKLWNMYAEQPVNTSPVDQIKS